MLSYNVQVLASEENEKLGTIFLLKISDLHMCLTKELRVKYSQLSEMHNTLSNDNPYAQVPSYSHFYVRYPNSRRRTSGGPCSAIS